MPAKHLQLARKVAEDIRAVPRLVALVELDGTWQAILAIVRAPEFRMVDKIAFDRIENRARPLENFIDAVRRLVIWGQL